MKTTIFIDLCRQLRVKIKKIGIKYAKRKH